MEPPDLQSASVREPRVVAPEDLRPLLRRFRGAGVGGGLDVRVTRQEDTDDVLALQRSVFPDARDRKHAQWKQWGSPAGAPVSAHARRLEDGKVVSAITGIRRRVWVDGYRNDAVQTCETCSDPAMHDGGRAYKRTVEASAVHALEDCGILWAYGSQTTDDALRIGERWFGFEHVFSLESLEIRLSFSAALGQRWGFTGRMVARGADRVLQSARGFRSQRWHIGPAVRFGREFDALWERYRHAYRVVICRDAKELQWRYADNPLWRHHTLLASCPSGPAGYIVWREWQPDGVRVATVMDLWAGEQEDLARALLAAACRDAVSRGCVFLRFAVQPGRAGERAMRRFSGCRPVPHERPDRVIIGPTHGASYGYLPREGVAVLRAVRDPAGWYYTQGDCDLRD